MTPIPVNSKATGREIGTDMRPRSVGREVPSPSSKVMPVTSVARVDG